MYVRPSNTGARTIKLPENYSGNAFSSHSPYSDMPPPTRTTQPRSDIPPEAVGTDTRSVFRQESGQTSVQTERHEEVFANEENENVHSPVGTAPSLPASSIFSSLLPRSDLSKHFPFGHGIGSEELLILAVMLMVFLSGNEKGEIDSEFLLLLGLLLFAG